jgi:transcriptional regulator with XRE-family HTH domain
MNVNRVIYETELVKERMMARGMTLKSIGEAADISPMTVASFLRTGIAGPAKVRAIALAVGLPVKEDLSILRPRQLEKVRA